MPATQSSGCAERKSTHFELILFWPAIGWNLAASADQPIAGQNRLSSKRVDIYSAQILGCGSQYDYSAAVHRGFQNFLFTLLITISDLIVYEIKTYLDEQLIEQHHGARGGSG